MKNFMLESLVIFLIFLVIFVEIIVILYILKHRKPKEVQQKEYEEWLAKLQSNPILWELYRAHWETRGRTIIAVLIDMTIVVGLLLLLLIKFNLFETVKLRCSIPDDALKTLLTIALTFIVVILFFGFYWLLGNSIGLKIMNIVAVDSKTGEVVPKKKFVYPHKYSYRKNRPIEYFFVPKDLILKKIIR